MIHHVPLKHQVFLLIEGHDLSRLQPSPPAPRPMPIMPEAIASDPSYLCDPSEQNAPQ